MLNLSLAVYWGNYPKQKVTKSDEFLEIYLFDQGLNIVSFMWRHNFFSCNVFISQFCVWIIQSNSFNVDQCVFTCGRVTSFIFLSVLDINECSTNSHSCDVNAVCGNTLGSYTCACKPGYSGINGRTCSGKLNSVI